MQSGDMPNAILHIRAEQWHEDQNIEVIGPTRCHNLRCFTLNQHAIKSSIFINSRCREKWVAIKIELVEIVGS